MKVALVTGAAGNLGRATAAALASRGFRIAALDRLAAPLEQVVAGLPAPEAHLVLDGVDLMDAAACAAAVARVTSHFGRLDGVAHTVGGFTNAPIEEAGPAMWEQMFRLNLLTTVNIFAAAIAAMRPAGAGSLVAIGAMAALRSPGTLGAYSASKSGVLRLVESHAEELKPTGLRVNAVLPGTMDTPQNRAAMPDADPALWVQPAQLAEAIAFLLSDAASGITGALLPVTGRG
ncbi:SDR family NAD(P)-dependent oxidoreductase [Falsiroseomonas selenitidurans]|uniref:SDR family NAD(P)-dependent oxidoreductase n=1 Tax=Falsiroseomonas selenitidurans TaxID=2716335 RepID=A0ABX1E359_9PROT|nr:SDR family NAD(P)-dependent oxidoreductase [Falsiroseomonas selenitidurans]NKC31446.1 SDR family NAD(P)-dependent oxidoreductase [Falsiroseomonas selenitidurans]